MKEHLEAIGKIVAAITLLVLTLSVVYERAYFSVIGTTFQRFMSASDYFASVIAWLFPSVISIGLTVLLVTVIVRLKGWPKEYKDFRPDFSLTFWNKDGSRDRETITLYLFLVFLAFSSVVMEFLFFPATSNTIYVLAFAALWPLLVVFIFVHKNAPKFNSLFLGFATLLGPPILALVFVTGQEAGYVALKGFQDVHAIRLKNEAPERRVIILRTLEKGLLFRDPVRGMIAFFPWVEIQSVERTIPADIRRIDPQVCLLLGWRCTDSFIIP